MSLSTSVRAEGLFDSLRELSRNAIDVMHTRLDLLVTELTEEQAHLAELLLIAALSLLCFFLGVVFVAFFIVVVFWDTPYRLFATGLIAAVLLLTATGLWLAFRAKGKDRARMLSATLHELAVDRDRLQ